MTLNDRRKERQTEEEKEDKIKERTGLTFGIRSPRRRQI